VKLKNLLENLKTYHIEKSVIDKIYSELLKFSMSNLIPIKVVNITSDIKNLVKDKDFKLLIIFTKRQLKRMEQMTGIYIPRDKKTKIIYIHAPKHLDGYDPKQFWILIKHELIHALDHIETNDKTLFINPDNADASYWNSELEINANYHELLDNLQKFGKENIKTKKDLEQFIIKNISNSKDFISTIPKYIERLKKERIITNLKG